MQSDQNQVTLTGTVLADPTSRATSTGKTIHNFVVSTTRQWTDRSGTPHERAELIQVSTWLGRNLPRQGDRVRVEARLSGRTFDDRRGERRYAVDVTATCWEILDQAEAPVSGDPTRPGSFGDNVSRQASAPATRIDDGDIPF